MSRTINKLLQGTDNPLWYILCYGYEESKKTEKLMAEFCRLYVSTTQTATHNYRIQIKMREFGHCGYCSDADGSYDEDNIAVDSLYLQIPPNMNLENMHALYEDFGTYICSCGGQEKVYSILSILPV